MAFQLPTLGQIITQRFSFAMWIELIKSEAERAGINLSNNHEFLHRAAFTAQAVRQSGETLEKAAAEGIATHAHLI